MILYALVCDDGHRFDSWFRDSVAFDDQAAAGRLACPVCGSCHVAKAVMAPALLGQGDARKTDVTRKNDEAGPKDDAESKDVTGRKGVTGRNDIALIDPASREIRNMLQALRDKVMAEGHDVGPKFAAEARRIHDGEVPHRQIYGQATVGEARDLLEDGILVLPLPAAPDELN